MFTCSLTIIDVKWKTNCHDFLKQIISLSPWRHANQISQPTQYLNSELCFALSFSPHLSMQHLSSSYTVALHPACLSGCLRALKVSTANSTWALNYLINLGWQDRLKPLCDPQAPYTDISHWMRGHNLLPFFETLKCITRFISNPQLYLYGSLPVFL